MSETRFWCFTLNNPSEDDEQRVTDFLSSADVTYGIFGRETGESGTPHLQGFIILNRSRRLSYLTGKFQAHYTRRHARSTNEQARDYCKKDDDFEEFGTFPESAQGKRSDLESIIQWGDTFIAENGRAPDATDFAREQPVAYVKFPRLTEMFALRAPPRALQAGEPNEWQRELHDVLLDEPEDRKILFVEDPDGGKGKSWFIRWMYSQYPEQVQILGVGKRDDIAFMLDPRKSIFLFNCARGQMEYLSYPLLEQLKDRMVLSGKYSSTIKLWTNNVHVVVFGNETADMEKMTGDRYEIMQI